MGNRSAILHRNRGADRRWQIGNRISFVGPPAIFEIPAMHIAFAVSASGFTNVLALVMAGHINRFDSIDRYKS